MGDKSKISWTDATWNPVVGCTKASEGCAHCYAERDHNKRHKAFCEGKLQNVPQYSKPFNQVQLIESRLDQPIKWKRPRKIFVNSQSDLFHPDVQFEFIDKVFAVMAIAKQHTFQILTKRPDRMLEYLSNEWREALIEGNMQRMLSEIHGRKVWIDNEAFFFRDLANLITMTTVENQKRADERLPLLIKAKDYLKNCKLGISIEPMLGPIELRGHKDFIIECPVCRGSGNIGSGFHNRCPKCKGGRRIYAFDWVICGGESGSKARLMQPEWVRSLRDQCTAADVPFFFKQWGEYRGHLDGVRMPGNVLDGQTWQQMPEVV
ncbi:MAG TPA: phage Gp37/Gp68 family protein [Ignavibacteriales bacterium]|nr:phage Gp37/Gp68 family protein [Ignavibacteriales bacterium]